MNTTENTRELITGYVEHIWNRRDFDLMKVYCHPDFIDHSLPDTIPPDASGVRQWILLTGASFDHRTVISEQVTEKDKSMIKIRMYLRHIGRWRNLDATLKEVAVVGYRFFRIKDQQILEHWGLIDGNALETQLKNASQGCKTQD